MLQLGTVTYNIAKDWDLDTILKKLEALKFEGVELRTGHKHGVEVGLTKEQRDEVKQEVRRLARRAGRARQRVRVPVDRPGRRSRRTSRGPRPTSAWPTTSARPA